MTIAITFVVGVIFGTILVLTFCHSATVGSIRVDTSDPDGPYMFLELAKDVPYVCSRKYITLSVNTKNFITRK